MEFIILDVCASAEYKELQTKCSRQFDDIDNHLRSLADLEKEKMDLVEGKLITTAMLS